MTFAVVGATGKVGRATIRALRQRGEPVRAVVRDASSAGALAAAGCEIAVADLRDSRALAAALDGAQAVQVICPISAQADDAASDMRAVVDSIASALAAARPAAVVAISDYGAEVDAGTGVTLIFHHLEARLRAIPSALTLLRSAEHMQNWRRHITIATERGILPSLHQPLTKRFPTVSAIDVGVVAADLLVTPHTSAQPRIVHAEGPRRYTPLDVAAAFRGLVGREVVAREVPRAEWIPALMRGGLSESYAGLVAELFEAHNAGRIDAEAGVGEIRRGTTELADVIGGFGA